MTDKKHNVQVYPSKVSIVPNCKLVKTINNLSDEKYSDMIINKNSRGIIEKKNHKNFGDVVTTYRLIRNDEEDDGSDPLNEFDRAVLSVCISEWEVGNRHTTPAMILRGLTGKTGMKGKGKIHKDQYAAITNSVKKMMGIVFELKFHRQI